MAFKVTDRLVAWLIDNVMIACVAHVQTSLGFFTTQAAVSRRQLVEHAAIARKMSNANEVDAAAVETEVLQARYRSILAKIAEVELSTALESRQIGRQLRFVEVARLPETPLGLSRMAFTAYGTCTGLVIGGPVAMFADARRRVKP